MNASEMRDLIPDSNRLEYFTPLLSTNDEGGATDPLQVMRAYEGGFNGAFTQSDLSPDWCRRLARHFRDGWLAERPAGDRYVEQVMPPQKHGSGKGQRVVSFAYVMKIMASALSGNQDYGNCVAWGCREISNTLVGLAIALGRPMRMTHRHGTARVYGDRGSSGQGMVLDVAHNILADGQSEEKNYPGIVDVSTEAQDESAGNGWGRRGVPEEFRKACRGNCVRKAWLLEDDQDPDVVRDVFMAGGVLNTGSNYTGGGKCDPVCSSIKVIGGHDQAFLGFDDTDEFKAAYKALTGKTVAANDFVAFMDQSWGPSWIALSGWFDQLWGPRPEGMIPMLFSQAKRLWRGDCWGLTGPEGFVDEEIPDWRTWEYL